MDRVLRGAHGFTLVELLVVLAILALLAGVIGPQVLGYLDSAKSDSAGLQIKNIEAALDLYRIDAGIYPTTEQGLAVLVQRPAGAARWNGPYLKGKEPPEDPWGRDYVYQGPDGERSGYLLYTLGADGAPGGSGADQDIGTLN
jgi:general secretion pathway protein G